MISLVVDLFAIVGAVSVVRWLLAQRRAYSGVNHPIAWYMRPK